uniref:ribonuclease H n=1 Tax=Buteo japonicus TaxID=224669 RepID=A0A8C0B244_9AVES
MFVPEFLYMPECPLPLMGRDLVHIPQNNAWEVQLYVLQELLGTAEDKEKEVNSIAEIEDAVTPFLWATEKPGRAKSAEPVKIELKYPIKLEAHVGLEPIINNFLKYRLLQECQSEYNTPILPVKKPHSWEYRLVQDLRAINQIVVDVHPVVPNPYTLLMTIIDSNVYFTVLDLKDAFLCIPVEEQSQKLFAFEWERLLQGFKNSPTIFGNVVAKELEQWQGKEANVTLLQYVDNILLGADTAAGRRERQRRCQ